MLGRQRLFHPLEYGNSKEPCDVAWVANRCAVLMWMTESKHSFEKCVRHNTRQMKKQIAKWKAGLPLEGNQDGRKFSIPFEDVDHIVCLSIVDGENSSSQFHEEITGLLRPLKVMACATISGEVIRALYETGSGIREILAWLVEMRRDSHMRIPNEAFIMQIRHHLVVMEQRIRKAYRLDSALQHNDLITAHEVYAFIASANEGPVTLDVSYLTADLGIYDKLWLVFATIGMQKEMPTPGDFGPLTAYCRLNVDQYSIESIVCANPKQMQLYAEERLKPPFAALSLFTVMHGDIAGFRTWMAQPKTWTSNMEKVLKDFEKFV